MIKKGTVAVGLSGGVDSAMAALILLEEGYDVTGLTMLAWGGDSCRSENVRSGCFGPDSLHNVKIAANISNRLGIPHQVINLSTEFRALVLDYYCSTHKQGRTPNPCLVCNPLIKFGLLAKKAREQGLRFDYFATGHYARSEYGERNRRWQLKCALDTAKDQSYFLAYLDQEQLRKVMFPLGGFSKLDIRKKAIACGYADLAGQPESQDFLPMGDHGPLFRDGDFQPGDIVDVRGRLLGRHRGLVHYTIGQRRNLGVAGQAEPFFVIDIDLKDNRLVAGPQRYLYGIICKAVNINWVSIEPPERPFWTKAKIRYQHEPADCYVMPMDEHTAEVNFEKPQPSITPGQGIVFYDRDTVFGGGFIDKI